MAGRSVDHKAAPLLQKIKTAFPELTWSNYRYIDEGWDHEVVILDDRFVFRFPDDDEYRQKLKKEIDVLQFLTDKVGVVIPRYEYVSQAIDFAGYPMIPGKQLSKAQVASLPSAEYDSLTRQLADFLSAIHALPIQEGVLSTVPLSYLKDDQADIRKSLAQVKAVLSAEDFAVCLEILAGIDTLQKQSLPRVFIHNDIYVRHLLWDGQTKKLGIIDFSDMCLGDPAVDFAELYELGAQFVKDVYGYYAGPKDETFLDRAWKYQRWVGVYMMTDYFEIHKTTFEVARETFDRVKLGTPAK